MLKPKRSVTVFGKVFKFCYLKVIQTMKTSAPILGGKNQSLWAVERNISL
jgi:hypothetical protein